MNEIIVAIISGGLTLAGVVITVVVGNKKISNLIEYRIEQLEKKQEKHNTLIERMYEAEKNIKLLDERIEANNQRIEDLALIIK